MAFLGSPARTQLDIPPKVAAGSDSVWGRLSHSLPPKHMFLPIPLYQQEQLSDLMARQFKELRGRKKTLCFLLV